MMKTRDKVVSVYLCLYTCADRLTLCILTSDKTYCRLGRPRLHSAGVALPGSKSGRSGCGCDKIEDLLVSLLSAGFSFEHIMAMSLRLKGPVC